MPKNFGQLADFASGIPTFRSLRVDGAWKGILRANSLSVYAWFQLPVPLQLLILMDYSHEIRNECPLQWNQPVADVRHFCHCQHGGHANVWSCRYDSLIQFYKPEKLVEWVGYIRQQKSCLYFKDDVVKLCIEVLDNVTGLWKCEWHHCLNISVALSLGIECKQELVGFCCYNCRNSSLWIFRAQKGIFK